MWNYPNRSLAGMSHTRFRRLGHASGQTFLVSGQHEEQKAQAVEPPAHLGIVKASRTLERQAAALRPAGDRASQVQSTRGRGGPGQDEAVRHRDRLLELRREFL